VTQMSQHNFLAVFFLSDFTRTGCKNWDRPVANPQMLGVVCN
jgi:hypothetical protein